MFRRGVRLIAALWAACACLPVCAQINPETGAFLFHNYTAKDYSASPQNWAIVQDTRGVMYFGNTEGVLEFDGVFWRLIPLSNGGAAQALAIDSAGTVFVAGDNILGYLAADSHGTTRFFSLVDRLPKADRSFGTIRDILPTADGVYFCSRRRLFLLSKNPAVPAKVWTPSDRFGRAFSAYEELYVTTTDRGLLQMTKFGLAPSLRGDDKLLRKSPFFAFGPHPVLANARGLFHFSLSSVDPFPTPASSYFEDHSIAAVAELPDGQVLVGTVNGGVVLLNKDGGIERLLTKKTGLVGDKISAFFEDREGGIWIAADGGLSRFETSVSTFGELQGLAGQLRALGRLQGAVYVGTTSGLFRMNATPGAEPDFEPVPAIPEEVVVIVDHGYISLVGSRNALYELSGTQATRLLKTDTVYDIAFSSREPETVYIAGNDGAQMLRRNGRTWSVVSKLSEGQQFRMIVEDPDGRVWVTTGADTIARIDLHAQPPTSEEFKAAAGVPTGMKNAYLFHGHPVFATNRGLLKFSAPERRFVPDTELGPQFADGSKAVSTLREDKSGNVWITGTGYNGILLKQKSGGYLWFAQPLLETGIGEMWQIRLDDDGTPWVCDSTNVYRGEAGLLHRVKSNFNVLIRSGVVTGRNAVLFEGDGPGIAAPHLPYSDNALRFEFSAPFPEDQAGVKYQVRLEGSDGQWSPWTTETRRDYTNLPERNYRFHVRAQNAHEIVSAEAAFPFSVRAPWYRTWWAYACYVAVFLFAGWLILRWRLSVLEAKNKWLEHVVDERTAEVRSERDQNEALLLNILPKPVASELRATGAVKPTSFDDVTVCFSDFVGFTLSSEKMPAEELISSLNDYFTAFDEIIGRYGLEKLKTIGDAYMFAGGLPAPSGSHAVDAVLAALEMVAASRRLARPEKGVTWRIRLGLYSGPVVAGVVGKRKFAFDIWGNTVNFAARMESSGSPDRVNLSQTTCSLVSDFIECEPRGHVKIKEGREMSMFFALRPRPELLEGPLEDGIPAAFRAKYEAVYSVPPKSFPDLAIFEESLLESRLA